MRHLFERVRTTRQTPETEKNNIQTTREMYLKRFWIDSNQNFLKKKKILL